MATAVFETNYGTIKFKLFESEHKRFFIGLLNKDFYKRSMFFRVVKDHFVQGGCHVGDGSSKLENKSALFCPNLLKNLHEPFHVGLHTINRKCTGLFYIVTAPKGVPWFDGKHPIIGAVQSPEAQRVVKILNNCPLKKSMIPESLCVIKRSFVER